MEETYLLIDGNGKAVNSIAWDGVTDYLMPPGHSCVKHSGRWGIGWKWDGTQCIDPNPPPPPPPPPPAPPAAPAPSGIKVI